MTPLTLGAKTLSKGRDQGGRLSKTVDAASVRARSPAGVDRGRRRFRPVFTECVPSLQRQSFVRGVGGNNTRLSVTAFEVSRFRARYFSERPFFPRPGAAESGITLSCVYNGI